MPSELGGEIYCTPAAWPKNSLDFGASASHLVWLVAFGIGFCTTARPVLAQEKTICEVKADDNLRFERSHARFNASFDSEFLVSRV